MRQIVFPSACVVSLRDVQTRAPQTGVLGLSASEVHVLRIAAATRRGALIAEVEDQAGLSRNAAQVRLRVLRDQGFLEVPSLRWAGKVKYRITGRGREALAQLARTAK
jgi:hypothetical protein